jgi:hypothetical protein
MQRLLLGKVWYESVPPYTLADPQYEELLLENADELISDFFVVSFRQRISTAAGHAQPHLALIDRKYRSWWLVLLETGPAPDIQFMQSQVGILREGRYDVPDIVDMLIAREYRLDRNKLRTLLATQPPSIHFLLGHPPVPSFKHPAVLIGIVEVFQSMTGQRILRVNGEHPSPPSEDIVATCTRAAIVAKNALKAKLLAQIQLSGIVSIEYEERPTEWNIVDVEGDLYFVPDAGVRLPVGINVFVLMKAESGKMRLLPKKEEV